MDTVSPIQKIAFEFHGKPGEYFRIWIVNICLSIITLGLYSPWAKVRERRYLYGSTRLAGASFDYLAKPWNIFKGRMIAIGIALVFFGLNHLSPLFIFLSGLAFLFAIPWLIIQTLRFNRYHTVYRNIRFGFEANYLDAIITFALLPIFFGPISLGLALPWVYSEQKKFMVNHGSYGEHLFNADLKAGDFWLIFFRFLLYLIKILVYLSVLIAILYGLSVLLGHIGIQQNVASLKNFFEAKDNKEIKDFLSVAIIFLTSLFYIGAILFFKLYMDVAVTNLTWNKTNIAGIRFQSGLDVFSMLVIYLTNIIAIIVSFGLLIPWAKIRTTRYRLDCLSVLCTPEELENFAAGQKQAVGALGEELDDFLDVDIGL